MNNINSEVNEHGMVHLSSSTELYEIDWVNDSDEKKCTVTYHGRIEDLAAAIKDSIFASSKRKSQELPSIDVLCQELKECRLENEEKFAQKRMKSKGIGVGD